jgi:predicted dinucleotide-binding enzyme
MDMDIGIIGSGHIGSTLARHLAALGHRVSIANSRGPASLAALAADTGATAATAEQAARARDMVIIAVPEKSVWQLPRDILATTSAIVVDAGNYYPSRDSRIPEIEREARFAFVDTVHHGRDRNSAIEELHPCIFFAIVGPVKQRTDTQL